MKEDSCRVKTRHVEHTDNLICQESSMHSEIKTSQTFTPHPVFYSQAAENPSVLLYPSYRTSSTTSEWAGYGFNPCSIYQITHLSDLFFSQKWRVLLFEIFQPHSYPVHIATFKAQGTSKEHNC